LIAGRTESTVASTTVSGIGAKIAGIGAKTGGIAITGRARHVSLPGSTGALIDVNAV
jgi:hypothetical protein